MIVASVYGGITEYKLSNLKDSGVVTYGSDTSYDRAAWDERIDKGITAGQDFCHVCIRKIQKRLRPT